VERVPKGHFRRGVSLAGGSHPLPGRLR
jgi:hypothetical protein